MAHASLVSAAPARNSISATAPTEVRLVFDDDLIAANVNANVIIVRAGSPTGAQVDLGNSYVSGASISVGLPALTAGTYFVSYRIVSNDGHPVNSDYQFTVTETSKSTSSPALSLGVRKSLGKALIARDAGLTVSSKATVSISVAGGSKKFCKVSGTKLVGIKPGACRVSIAVVAKALKGKSKPKKSTGSILYQVK
jgi:methionine-rich copper-binding protein CopC